MPVRYLSDPELARLSTWPAEIADEDAVTYFTLSADDLSWLAGFNRDENRLGVAVQLCTLPWLGWIPDDLGGCPPPALGRLAAALAIDAHSAAALLAAYGGWQGETRRRHRVQVLARRGWRWCAAGERKLLDEFLLTRALEHDAPGVLVQLACDWMRAERIVRPPVDTLTRRVAAARDAARAETYHRLGPQLQPPRPSQLDGLLDVDPELGITRLAWLRRGATAATPEMLKAELDKLEFLRRHGAGQLDLSHRPCALVGQPVLAAGKRPIRVIAWLGSRKVSVAIRICPPAAIRKSSWLSPSVSACRSALLGSGCRIWRKPTTAGRRRAERYCARRDTLSANCRKRQIGGLKPGGCRGSEAGRGR